MATRSRSRSSEQHRVAVAGSWLAVQNAKAAGQRQAEEAAAQRVVTLEAQQAQQLQRKLNKQATKTAKLQQAEEEAANQVAAEEARRAQQLQRRRNRETAEEQRKAAAADSQLRQEADADKLRRARAKRRGIMVNRWRSLQQTMRQGEDAVDKGTRGVIYNLADRTLAELEGSSMVAAVQHKLDSTPAESWGQARQQLQRAAEVGFSRGETIGDKATVQRALEHVIQVVEADSQVGCLQTVAAVAEVLYATAATALSLSAAATELWDEQHFHAVRIKVKIEGADVC
jgi:hypothetical protein